MIDWETVENAIWAWFVSGSGFATGNVIWADRGEVPAGSYISLSWLAIDRAGHDWVDRTAEGVDEVRYTARGHRVSVLRAQCIAPNGPDQGANRCAAVLDRVLSGRILPMRAAALRAAGVGIGPIGGISPLQPLRSGLLEPRAIVEIDIHLAQEVSEVGPRVMHVEMERDVGFGPESSTITPPDD